MGDGGCWRWAFGCFLKLSASVGKGSDDVGNAVFIIWFPCLAISESSGTTRALGRGCRVSLMFWWAPGALGGVVGLGAGELSPHPPAIISSSFCRYPERGLVVGNLLRYSSPSKMGGWPAMYWGHERYAWPLGLLCLVVVSGLALLSTAPAKEMGFLREDSPLLWYVEGVPLLVR